MGEALTAFLLALGTVVLAEMGDKTQLLAMAFATKYKALKVMTGVFIATVLNHALAVALGSVISRFDALNLWIQIIASASFLFFALWTIRGDKLDKEKEKKPRFGPIVTVSIAFFIAELGDKTQLATIALATKYPVDPVWVLAGTTLGMLIADGIGILIGVVLCKKIPEKIVKYISAAAFAVFGLIGCYQTLTERLKLGIPETIGILAGLAIITGVIAFFLIRKGIIQDREKAEEVAAYCALRPDARVRSEEAAGE